MNELRQAPAPPSRVAPASVRVRIASSGSSPPWSRTSSAARRIHGSRSWSADSKPSTSSASSPEPPAEVAASPGSSSRQFAGSSPDCDSARTARTPSAKLAKRTLALARRVGPVLQAHPRLGDHAERALRADEEAVGRRAGARARQPPRRDDTGGCHDAQRLDELVDVRVVRREVPAAAGRDPAAERAELERLRVVAQRESVRAELVLERRAEHARLHARGARRAVDLEHPRQLREVERDHAAVVAGDPRLDPADHARAAAEHDRRDPLARAVVEHVGDLGLARRDTRPSRAGARSRAAARAPRRDSSCRSCGGRAPTARRRRSPRAPRAASRAAPVARSPRSAAAARGRGRSGRSVRPGSGPGGCGRRRPGPRPRTPSQRTKVASPAHYGRPRRASREAARTR